MKEITIKSTVVALAILSCYLFIRCQFVGGGILALAYFLVIARYEHLF